MCAHVWVSEALPCRLGQGKAGLPVAARAAAEDGWHRQATLVLVWQHMVQSAIPPAIKRFPSSCGCQGVCREDYASPWFSALEKSRF